MLGVDRSQGLVKPIDPATVRHPEGEEAGIPGSADLGLAGGTLAAADPVTGKVWAQHVDPAFGPLSVSGIDSGRSPVERPRSRRRARRHPGRGSAGDLRRRRHGDPVGVAGVGFAKPETQGLPDDVGPGTGVTAVGDTAVVLDPDGSLTVVGQDRMVQVRPEARCSSSPARTPTPSSSDSPAGCSRSSSARARSRLSRTGSSGRPAAPVRLGVCAYGAWSGGSGAVATACDGSDPVGARWADRQPTSSSGSTAARSCSTTVPAVPCGTSTPTSRPGSTTGRASARSRTDKNQNTGRGRAAATCSLPRPSPTTSVPAPAARPCCTPSTTTPRPRDDCSRSSRSRASAARPT